MKDTLPDYENYTKKWNEWLKEQYENLTTFPDFIDGVETVTSLNHINSIIKLSPKIITMCPYDKNIIIKTTDFYNTLDTTIYNLNNISANEIQIEEIADSSKYLNIKYDENTLIITIEKTIDNIAWDHILLAYGCYRKAIAAYK